MTEHEYETVIYQCTSDLLMRLRDCAKETLLFSSLRKRNDLALSRISESHPPALSTDDIERALDYSKSLLEEVRHNLTAHSQAESRERRELLPTLKTGLSLDEEVLWLERWLSVKRQEN